MKKRKLNKNGKRLICLILVLMVIILIPLFVRLYKINTLRKLKYDKVSIREILNKKVYKEINEIGYNKTINYLVKSDSFNVKNINIYKDIDYVDQKDLCINLNKLIKIGYGTDEINLIIKNSTNEVLNDFVKKKKIKDISKYLKYDYAKTRYIDRYIKYREKTNEDYDKVVTYVNIGLDNDFYTNTKTTDNYNIYVLVNKYNGITEKYKPESLTVIDKKYWKDNEEQSASKVAVEAFYEMAEDASKEGYTILVNSSYRSYEDQEKIYNLYKKTYGEKYALNYAALPGFSEHQTGLVFDVAAKGSDIFGNSKESTWMSKNAYKYGFILRYPKGKENITGYKYEAWHFRYVGKKIAKYVQENNITYDEYYYKFVDKVK